MKKFALASLVALIAPVAAQAAVITFEPPAYTLSTVNPGPPVTITNPFVPYGGVSATKYDFNGQDAWATSSSNYNGAVVATANSGSYLGGQGVQGSGGISLITAKTMPGFSVTGTGVNGFEYDVQYNQMADMGVGGWVDEDDDGKFLQAEFQFIVGINWDGKFGLRTDNFGTRMSSPTSAVLNTWYHIKASLDDATFTITMDVSDLTNGGLVDLDPATASNSYVKVLTAAQYNNLSSNYDGIALRISGANVFDNIATIPEPASLMTAILGGSMLLLRRKHA